MYDLFAVIIFIFEEWLVVVLSGWQSNRLCCFFVWNRKKLRYLARKGLTSTLVICKGNSTRILTFRVGDFSQLSNGNRQTKVYLLISLLFRSYLHGFTNKNTKTNNVIRDIRIQNACTSVWFCMKNKPARAPDSRTWIFLKFISLFISVQIRL